jgi:hypothetical protein
MGPREFHGLHDQVFNAANFDLYVQKRRTTVVGQHFLQGGWHLIGRVARSVYLFQGLAADHQAMEFRIVAKNGLAVTRGADIKFEPLSAVLKSQVEGGQRILGRVKAGAAMSEQ